MKHSRIWSDASLGMSSAIRQRVSKRGRSAVFNTMLNPSAHRYMVTALQHRGSFSTFIIDNLRPESG